MYNNASSTHGPEVYYDVNMVPKTTSDVPRISREMGMIQKLLAEHNETAQMVEQRLNAVLRPANQNAEGGNTGEPRPVSSPLTSDLEGFRDQLSRLLYRYNDILGRLEI